MGIFILAFLATAFISLCFFKQRFWENRFIVLAIGAGVAFIATLTTNYVVKDKSNIKSEIIWSIPLHNLAMDSTKISNGLPLIENLDDFQSTLSETDSIKTYNYPFLIHRRKEGESIRVSYFFKKEEDSTTTNGTISLSKVYFLPNTVDTLSYFRKVKINYNVESSKWRSNLGLPRLKTMYCFFVQPEMFESLPDSVKQELPYNVQQ